jgi:hypothetical protein
MIKLLLTNITIIDLEFDCSKINGIIQAFLSRFLDKVGKIKYSVETKILDR